MDRRKSSRQLERTLGLPATMAIGVGTMVGAGIFVFPGIAAGQAGPAAMVSFALAGLIALLVALSTAELATAMPESGGGYYFVSRVFGPMWGTLVGVGQWVGLVFASSFYLVGFGQYAARFLSEIGYALHDPPILVALATALVLTAVNIIGTERAGKLQNRIVIALTGILTMLFLYGLLNALGVLGKPQLPLPFAPKGTRPIFTTTALIFTSYLGFVQIATVAGEVKSPHRTLPRALIGSVLVVALLYILGLFVSTSVFSTEKLAELGETAMVEVGRELIGPLGGIVVMGAGLLATLSSANASILSSSRAIYALAKDDMMPKAVRRVNRRFGTPHIALIAVGIPIAGLVLIGKIEVLAEVASLLHLVIYGLICLVLLSMRRRRPLWYAPTFRAPAAVLISSLGALASFGLIVLMKPLSLAIGLGVLLLALLWYWSYAKGKKLGSPVPPHIIPALREPKIIMPLEIERPKAAQPPVELLRAFRSLDLFILGYKVVPEQTSPEQAREESKGKEQDRLDEMVKDFNIEGVSVENELVFTPDPAKTVSQYTGQKNCQALLTPMPIKSLERLLVPVYSKSQINSRLATILRTLALSSDLPITLLLLKRDSRAEESNGMGPEDLRDIAIRRIIQAGLSSKQIRSTSVSVTSLAEAIIQIAGEEDLVVLGEADKGKRTNLLSELYKKVRKKISCPTLVVFRVEDEQKEAS